MQCPLCESIKSIVVRSSNLLELKSSWIRSFGFDPFPSDYVVKQIDKKRCTSCHLEFFDPPLYGDADFYAKLSKYPWYYEQNKWEYDVAAESVINLLPENLLEIGCGNGHFLEKIISLGVDADGVDINKDAVAACKSKGLSVEAVNVFDLTKSYDMVVLFEVLEHMECAKELFEFLTTKLVRPGGYLIIAVPNPDGYLNEVDLNLLDMPPHHNSRWSLKCFEQLQSLYGLTLLEYKKEPLRYVHYSSYLQYVISSTANISRPSWKSRLFYKLQALLIRILAPLTYLNGRERIDGQTHLVVLRNDR
jgi:2-polyprenyl-3-methyl-5-hydroxy-6-metoxy-1,4-benzoquinol methylase